MARLRAAAQALEVEHAVCRSFQQPLVVRNEQNGLFQSAYHLLQPYKRLKIQVVGRLVQQPDGGFLKKHLCEEQFDFLPARQRPHALIRPEKPRFHAQPARVFRQLARIRRIQCGRKKFHRADCGEFGFLREISRPLAAEISLSLSHGVFLRQFFVIKIFQQRRPSVPPLPPIRAILSPSFSVSERSSTIGSRSLLWYKLTFISIIDSSCKKDFRLLPKVKRKKFEKRRGKSAARTGELRKKENDELFSATDRAPRRIRRAGRYCEKSYLYMSSPFPFAAIKIPQRERKVKRNYSTVTDFARLRGLSISLPRFSAT